MKKLCTILPAILLALPAWAEDSPLKDERDRVSYSMGVDIGTTFKKQGVDVNPEILMRGLKDGVSGATPLMTEEQRETTMRQYTKAMIEKQNSINQELAVKNSAAGEKFLAENKAKDGVKTTASGLQYKVLKEGSGPMPKETDTVVTHYRGTLLNGTEFDSSYKRNEPTSFPVNRVIKGWTEALQMMKAGSKYQLFIPASLAYGERGAQSGGIGPNETLIFEVELLEVKPAPGQDALGAGRPAPAATPAASAKPDKK